MMAVDIETAAILRVALISVLTLKGLHVKTGGIFSFSFFIIKVWSKSYRIFKPIVTYVLRLLT